jgi:hypothetical protein
VEPEETTIARQLLRQHFSTSATSLDRSNGYTCNNVGTVGDSDFSAVRAEATTIEIAEGVGGDLDMCTAVRELHVAFKIPYVYDYIIKSCTTQVGVNLIRLNPNVRGTGHGEARHRKYKRPKLGGGQANDSSAD